MNARGRAAAEPSVSPLRVARRMISMRLSKADESAASAASGKRENRKTRPSQEPKAALRERWGAWRPRLERPLQVASRLGSVALRGVLVVAVAFGAIAVGRLVEAHVRKSPAFATKVIELNGNERLERDAVLRAAGLAIGQNTFDVSPESAEKSLQQHPWVATAKVTRRLPDTYSITIEERQAVALVALDEPYLVAADAAMFKRWEPGDPEDLPIVTGVDPETFDKDRVYRTSILVNVVALLHDYRDAGLWRRAPIQEIHLEADEGLSLVIGELATSVRLHRPPFRKKLARLKRVLTQLSAKNVEPAYVYLDNVRRGDRVTVRLR